MTSGNGRDRETLEYSLKYNPPIDLRVAERNLKEARQIFESLGVTFLLNSGTCLGAVRDNAFIPWDDDVDLISVAGANALTEDTRREAARAFAESGFYVGENRVIEYKSMSMIRDYVRVDWSCAYPAGGHIYSFPGVRLPAELYANPREIDFLGETFLVPNPPEEYLRLKYGGGWMVPRRPGEYEQDVVAGISDAGHAGRPCWIRVLDNLGNPVPESEVRVVGVGTFRSDHRGSCEVVLPGTGWHALVIRYANHERVLYMEDLEPDRSYVYRAESPDMAVAQTSGDFGTLGNVLTAE